MSDSKFGHRVIRLRSQMKKGGDDGHFNPLNPFKLGTLTNIKFDQTDTTEGRKLISQLGFKTNGA